MSLEEFCKKYGYAESTIKTKWNKTKKTIYNKTGIVIEKQGRGSNTKYIEVVSEDNRALAMFEETKDAVIMDKHAFSFENLEFNCFLGIILTPMMVFRGTYSELANYIGVDGKDKKIIEKIKNAVRSLKEREIIFLYEDNSVDRELITITLIGKAEDEMKIGIEMIKTCKKLADQYNKHSWVPLLKTWLGMQIMSEDQPFTLAELTHLTGMSAYQIRESKKILESNDIFKTSKAYKSYMKCIGQNIDLNVFYNSNK